MCTPRGTLFFSMSILDTQPGRPKFLATMDPNLELFGVHLRDEDRLDDIFCFRSSSLELVATMAHQRLWSRSFFRFKVRLRQCCFPSPVAALASAKDIDARGRGSRGGLQNWFCISSFVRVLCIVWLQTKAPSVSFFIFVFVRVCIIFSLTYEYK
jgi:hypothetical protein